jgi:four helix bundle protein
VTGNSRKTPRQGREENMGRIESHRDLVVWQKAMDLTVMIYGLAAKLPLSETYRLVTQLTRAAASVPANIAEGHARGSRRDYANFLAVAKGSLMETETFVMLTVRLNYLNDDQAAPVLRLIAEISKMLTALRSRLLSPEPS